MRWFAPVMFVVSFGAAAAQAQPDPQPRFEVVSIKPGGDTLSTKPGRSGGRIRWTTQVCYLIGYASHIDVSLVSGKSCGSVYSVEATFDPAATDDQVRSMMQSLLSDRFRMLAHRVSTEADGFALVIGKGGPKIKGASPAAEPPDLPAWIRNPSSVLKAESFISSTIPEPGVTAVAGRNISMSQLAETLQRSMKMPVWDRTGLTGTYYFAFRYARDSGAADFTSDVPALATALQESLGLKLEKHRGTVETLVIDQIEAPAEN
jgi:uncharacterized protein (TIGR03435 family)